MSGRRVRRRARGRVVPGLVATLVTGIALTWWLVRLGPESGGEPDSAVPDSSSTSTTGATRGATPTASASSPASPSPVTPARRSGVAPEAPVQVRLPSGTTVPVRAVAARADGVLDVPDDVRTAGWWRGGSRIGDPFGATLIAAHIDSRRQGLGPYVELLSVERGAPIVVRSAHLTQTFEVTSLRLVPRESHAGTNDIFSVSGRRRLVMVTCAGPFDASRGGYQSLAIVTARPTSAASRRVR